MKSINKYNIPFGLLSSAAADSCDVELVVLAFLAVEHPLGPEFGVAVVLEDDVERRLTMMLVDNAELADVAGRPDRRRHLDDCLVLFDDAVVAVVEVNVQFRRCKIIVYCLLVVCAVIKKLFVRFCLDELLFMSKFTNDD